LEKAARNLPLAITPRSGAGFFAALAFLSLSGMPAGAAQVQVMLFGQPCSLDGPSEFTDAQLRAIHQVSPEQTPLSDNPSSVRSSLERVQSAGELPAAFVKYRDQRRSRLDARLKFEEAVAKAHRSGDANAFAEATRGLLHARRHSVLVKKLQAALKAGPSPRAWDEVRDYFVEFAGPDGEEDFHRTLRRLKIQYHCSFEAEKGEDESTTEAKPAPSR